MQGRYGGYVLPVSQAEFQRLSACGRQSGTKIPVPVLYAYSNIATARTNPAEAWRIL